MTRMPRVTGKRLVSALKRTGFKQVRQKSSHVYLQHPDGRTTVVPVHSGETIGIGLMSSILKDVKMTKEELQQWL